MIFYRGHRIILLVLIFLFSILISSNAQSNDSLKISQYNNLAVTLINQYKFEEAISICDSALRIKENATSYYLLAYIYNFESNWKKAIRNGEKAVQSDSTLMESYPVLFNAYSGAKRWKDAINIGEKAQKADRSGVVSSGLKIAIASRENENTSKIICLIFFIIFCFLLLIPVVRISKTKFKYFLGPGSHPHFTTLLLLTSIVTCLLYIVFFALSSWIWSLNPQISASEFTLIVRAFIFEHDGMESFFLYALMFINIVISLFIALWLLSRNLTKNQYLLGSVILLPVAGYFFYTIGFFPSMPDIAAGNGTALVIILALTFLSLALYSLYGKFRFVVKSILFILIAFTTLVVTYPNSRPDLAYILAPALRLIHGFKLSEIYFQYDLLLSLFGFAWMKLNLALEWFPFLGQLSFFLFFLGAFLFSDRFFKSKGLSVLFIIALLLIRYYAVWEQGTSIFQVTPLRLDLWLILLIVGYQKGIQHWLLGTCLGLLIILHRNLGLIYLGAYLILIISLFVIDLARLLQEKKLTVRSVFSVFLTHFRMQAKNLGIIAVSFILCLVLFGEIFSSSALIYRKYGIGMIPISKNSFYWYVPVIISSLAIILFYYRKKLSAKYFTTSLFIILLAVSNSVYFFGRSHEGNLLNISGVLILALFVLFDILVSFPSETETKPQQKNKKLPVKKSYPLQKRVYRFLPVLFIILTAYYYSNRIADKLNRKYDNLTQQQFVYPLLTDPIDTGTIKEITDNSRKVYFLDFQMDFYYYYYGNYAPLGYFSPCGAWVFKKDLIGFLQTLLNDQYFIVMNAKKANSFKEYLPYLPYNRSVEKNDLIAIHQETIPFLLSKDTNELFHIATKDSLSENGLDQPGPFLKNDFTIEVLLKPVGNQLPDAVILSNYTRSDVLRGFTLQLNKDITNEYIFAFGNGSVNTPSVVFTLENDKWHYVAITLNGEEIKVYDNGKLLTNFKPGGLAYLNSDIPLTIGNRQSRDGHFKGYIREVKISNGNANEIEILKKGKELDALLNTSSASK